ncbi:MAG: glycosyltransferase [Spirochaetia bacterium]|nr:glycosyltransferase [Spirochaetia bacterium]
MANGFTVYCWYDKENRFQQSNFRRWCRLLKKDTEAFEVIVFHDDPDIKSAMYTYENLRFWRLHQNMRKSPTGLMNEAMRYCRSKILVYVSPDVLARKTDLYRLANYVRSDYTLAWLFPRHGFFHEFKNKLVTLLNYVRWLFRIGRFELYARQNFPFGFYHASFFAVNKSEIDDVFSGLTITQKEKLLKNDHSESAYLNYYFFHLVIKSGLKKINSGNARSIEFIREIPRFFYSYKNTMIIFRQMFKRESFYFPLNIYRFLLPVMQLTQIFFFILVWFEPWKSLNLLAFYLILSSSLAGDIYKKKQWSPVIFIFWFFSWFVA